MRKRGETLARMRLDTTSASLGDVLRGRTTSLRPGLLPRRGASVGQPGGLVFDDPSISFDAERVEHIAGRIAELAATREQVIVFSCDLVFAWCLHRASEEQEVGFGVRPIARLGDKVGVVRRDQSWPGEPLKVRIGRLRDGLQTVGALERKGDEDEYEARAKNLAGDIREAWECAIEEDLFCGVVLRSSAT